MCANGQGLTAQALRCFEGRCDYRADHDPQHADAATNYPGSEDDRSETSEERTIDQDDDWIHISNEQAQNEDKLHPLGVPASHEGDIRGQHVFEQGGHDDEDMRSSIGDLGSSNEHSPGSSAILAFESRPHDRAYVGTWLGSDTPAPLSTVVSMTALEQLLELGEERCTRLTQSCGF